LAHSEIPTNARKPKKRDIITNFQKGTGGGGGGGGGGVGWGWGGVAEGGGTITNLKRHC